MDKLWTMPVMYAEGITMNLGRETEQKEYKESTGSLSEAADDICAILNKHGSGELYFRVRDDGEAIGKSEKTVQRGLAELQKTGYIERKGNYVSGKWHIIKI